jgi:hypothetical protein
MSRLAAALITQQRGLYARPVKQDASPAQPHAWNFAGRAPRKESPARNGQPRQQLFFVNEAIFTGRRLFWFATHAKIISPDMFTAITLPEDGAAKVSLGH